jgi:nucleotide-binding universal stress UspA family protein
MSETPDGDILKTLVSEDCPTVVAVDFSEDSRAAVLWASAFAVRAGGKLVVLHIVHDPAAEPGYYRRDASGPLQPMERLAERMLDEFLAQLQHRHPDLAPLQEAEKKLITGLPPGRIVEAAERMRAKLIVIGSRGMSGLPHLLQGSVSERVVELADRPVVVVKAHGGAWNANNRKKEEKAQRKAEKKQRKLEKRRVKGANSKDRAAPEPEGDGG